MRYLSHDKYQTVSLSVSLSLILASALSQYSFCSAQQSLAPPSKPRQLTPQQMTASTARVPAKMPPANDLFGKPTPLPVEKVVLDDIPRYPGGAKYKEGMVYEQNDGKGTVLMLVTYSITEPKNQVRDWYLNALRMYGWNITYQSDTVVNARNSKSGNYVNLQFYDVKSAKERSTLQIDYHKVGH